MSASAVESELEDLSLADIRKQVSLYFPVKDWKMLRAEAARLKIPITELCKRMMERGIEALRKATENE